MFIDLLFWLQLLELGEGQQLGQSQLGKVGEVNSA